MKKIFNLIIALLLSGLAQAQYTTRGIIEYERKSNIHRQLESMAEDGEMGRMIASFKSRIPKFQIDYFNYYFSENVSLYKPGREADQAGSQSRRPFGQAPATDNSVYTHFGKDSVIASKAVFESRYLIKDSVRKIQWKIQEEIRTIAGYKCRKAVGKMFDSVVIVAFYTDDIMINGGPEMFAGLPGLILEIAIPRLYTTWIATKVELVQPNAEDMTIPVKGKAIKQKELYDNLLKSITQWGAAGQRSIWWVFI